LDLTAFDAAEIDHVLELDLPQANVIEDEEQIPAVQAQAVSKLGDIWNCGDNCLGLSICLPEDELLFVVGEMVTCFCKSICFLLSSVSSVSCNPQRLQSRAILLASS
jgi:hypothetical protein